MEAPQYFHHFPTKNAADLTNQIGGVFFTYRIKLF